MASAKPPADPELREKLTTLVGRLTADLGIGGGRSAEGLAAASVAMLSKMTSPYDVTKVAVQQTQKTLTENAPDKRAFASEYARLKAMNVRELDKYLNVVAKIVQDPDLLAAVSTPRAPTRQKRGGSTPHRRARDDADGFTRTIDTSRHSNSQIRTHFTHSLKRAPLSPRSLTRSWCSFARTATWRGSARGAASAA